MHLPLTAYHDALSSAVASVTEAHTTHLSRKLIHIGLKGLSLERLKTLLVSRNGLTKCRGLLLSRNKELGSLGMSRRLLLHTAHLVRGGNSWVLEPLVVGCCLVSLCRFPVSINSGWVHPLGLLRSCLWCRGGRASHQSKILTHWRMLLLLLLLVLAKLWWGQWRMLLLVQRLLLLLKMKWLLVLLVQLVWSGWPLLLLLLLVLHPWCRRL